MDRLRIRACTQGRAERASSGIPQQTTRFGCPLLFRTDSGKQGCESVGGVYRCWSQRLSRRQPARNLGLFSDVGLKQGPRSLCTLLLTTSTGCGTAGGSHKFPVIVPASRKRRLVRTTASIHLRRRIQGLRSSAGMSRAGAADAVILSFVPSSPDWPGTRGIPHDTSDSFAVTGNSSRHIMVGSECHSSEFSSLVLDPLFGSSVLLPAPSGSPWLLLSPPRSSWILLSSPVSYWTLLATTGSSWLLLASPCYSWLLLAPPRSSCLFLAPPGSFSWLFLASPGSSWLLLAPPGSSWLLLAPPRSSWLLLAPPGSSWLLLAPPGSSWLLLAPPGSS